MGAVVETNAEYLSGSWRGGVEGRLRN